MLLVVSSAFLMAGSESLCSSNCVIVVPNLYICLATNVQSAQIPKKLETSPSVPFPSVSITQEIQEIEADKQGHLLRRPRSNEGRVMRSQQPLGKVPSFREAYFSLRPEAKTQPDHNHQQRTKQKILRSVEVRVRQRVHKNPC